MAVVVMEVVVADMTEEYEVGRIVNSRLTGRNKRLEYLVEWLGYEDLPESWTWEPKLNIHANNLVDKFHRLYPDKPGRKL